MLIRLLSYRWRWLLAALISWTVCSCAPIATGLLSQALFNRLQAQHAIWWAIAGLGAMAIVQPVLTVGWLWIHLTYETTLEALVQTNLFSWALTSSGRRGRRPSPVTMLGHLRDDIPEYTSLVNEWYRLAGEAAFVAIALVIMLRIDVTITLLAFLPLAAIVLGTHWMRSRLPRLWAQARDATTAATTFIGEMFAGAQAIRVAGAESAVASRFADLNAFRRRAEVRALAAEARIDAVTEATTIVGQAVVLFVGAGEMLSGRFSIGDFVLFNTYLEWMLMLPRRAGRLLGQQKTSERSRARLAAALHPTPVELLVEHRPVFLTGRRSERPRISGEPLRELIISGLSYAHPETGRGIIDIDICIRSGTLTVVAGPVGSGKSTLLDVLLGLRQADGGDIYWNGSRIDDPSTFLTPPRVAFKPQLPRLFNETLAETILLGVERDEELLAAAVRAAAFTDDVDRLPDRLETQIGSRGVRLSGGQAQRAALARVEVRRPQLYVIDDLSSALDDRTDRQLWRHIDDNIRRGGTYLIVSHRPAALDRADQIVRLNDGRISPT
jgi:ATP-binding cassette subfamily B protein